MTPFFNKNLQLSLYKLGNQPFISDPKVAAIFEDDQKNIRYFITEYRASEDAFFGYMKNKGEVDTWGTVPRNVIEFLYKVKQERSTSPLPPHVLTTPVPISEFSQKMKKEILFFQLEERMLERKKNKDIGQKPER